MMGLMTKPCNPKLDLRSLAGLSMKAPKKNIMNLEDDSP